MGMNLQWVAIEDGDKASVYERLGFEVVGSGGEELSGNFLGVQTPSGWLIIIDNRSQLKLDEAFASLTDESRKLGGLMVETVNYSDIREVRHGATLWSVARDPEKLEDDFLIEGELPPEAAAVVEHALEEQRSSGGGVDYLFDAPIELAQAICGYPFDEPYDGPWDLLFPMKAAQRAKPKPKPPSLLGRLFGTK